MRNIDRVEYATREWVDCSIVASCHTDRARCGRACATIVSDAVRLIRK
jgi:hypothetical protein